MLVADDRMFNTGDQLIAASDTLTRPVVGRTITRSETIRLCVSRLGSGKHVGVPGPVRGRPPAQDRSVMGRRSLVQTEESL